MAAKRPKNFTRFSRTITGGEGRSEVPVMCVGSVISSFSGLLALRSRLRSRQRRLLRVSVGGWSSPRLARLFGSILGSALGLNIGGTEYAVAPELAFGQGLRIVLEGIGRRFSPAVHDRQRV